MKIIIDSYKKNKMRKITLEMLIKADGIKEVKEENDKTYKS